MATYASANYKTPQITTGNPATVNDATQQNFPLGGGFLTFINGAPARLVYVLLNPVSTLGATYGGTPLYFTDGTATIVSDAPADSSTFLTGKDSDVGGFAGVLLNLHAALPTKGNYIWIQQTGVVTFEASAISAAVIKGDRAVLTNAVSSEPTAEQWTKLAGGTEVTAKDLQPWLYVISATTAVLANPFAA